MARPTDPPSNMPDPERDALWATKTYTVEQEPGDPELLRQIFHPGKLSNAEFERLMSKTVQQYGDNR